MFAILCAILAGLCWGVGEIFTKGAINTKEIGPMGAVFFRAGVTLPLALAAYLVAHSVVKSEPQVWWRDMSGSTWAKLIFGSGVLAGFAGVFFFYLGLAQPGGDISLLRPIAFALAPATAVILGWLILKEELTPRKIAAVVLIVCGIVLLTGGRKIPTPPGKGASSSATKGTPDGSPFGDASDTRATDESGSFPV